MAKAATEKTIPLTDVGCCYNRIKNRARGNPREKRKIEKMIPDIPVYELPFHHIHINSDGEESEEEVLGDGDRDEVDRGRKYVINEKATTYTRVKFPVKVYYESCYLNSGSVLHDKDYPVPTLTKLALGRYNTIECTNYEYVGLVKAYMMAIDGYHYTVRFKACLPGQDPVYFQAMIYQQIPNREKVAVDVDFVHPILQPSPLTKMPMSGNEDEEIPLLEVYKMIKKRRVMLPLRKEQKRRPKIIRSKKKMKKKNDTEEEKQPIHTYEFPFNHILINSNGEESANGEESEEGEESANGEESEEEVLRDGHRHEVDRGRNYVINENAITYTRVKCPDKVYYESCYHNSGSVLHDEDYPVPTLTKLAISRYNTIEGTNYKYFGLVKAYMMVVGGKHYTVRFKAGLPAQCPIYFQAMIYQRTPTRAKEVLVDVDIVHPLT